MRGFACVTALFLCLPVMASAQTKPANHLDVLKGLQVMKVVIEDIPEFRDSKARIKTAVQLRLRQNGIEVADDTEAGLPYLYINANALLLKDARNYVYSVEVSFQRLVSVYILPEKESKYTFGALWSRGTVGIAPVNEERLLREAVEELVDEFLNDYLAANPKR